MSEILFLAHRIPFPPDRGDKIRSNHVLRHLARLAPVHVATFAEDDFDAAEEASLAQVARSHCLVRRSKPLPLAGLQALASGQPVSLAAFHSHALETYVAQVHAERPISAIYVFSGQMGQYLPKAFRGRTIIDFVDVDSAKFDAYAEKKGGPRGWIDAREGRLLRDEEARLACRADAGLLISEAERDLMASRMTPADLARCSLRVMPNGIDSEMFDRAAVEPEAQLMQFDGPKLIFTGQMDYAPNVEAVERAMDRIVPLVRARVPDATFHIVGRNPPETLLSRHGRDGCHVWGRVPDMRTWLAAADLALVPLNIARGVQNKVLEAMAMALPVVLSPGAATGIGATDGTHFRVGESDEALANAVIDLLMEPDCAHAMVAAAREYIVENVRWEAALAPLAEWLGLAGGTIRDAA